MPGHLGGTEPLPTCALGLAHVDNSLKQDLGSFFIRVPYYFGDRKKDPSLALPMCSLASTDSGFTWAFGVVGIGYTRPGVGRRPK